MSLLELSWWALENALACAHEGATCSLGYLGRLSRVKRRLPTKCQLWTLHGDRVELVIGQASRRTVLEASAVLLHVVRVAGPWEGVLAH